MKKIIGILLSLLCLPLAAQSYFEWNESFDGSGLPDSWTQEVLNGSASWLVSDGSAQVVNDGALFGASVRLLTPQLDLSGVFAPHLVFRYMAPASAAGVDTLQVYYRNQQTTNWLPLVTCSRPTSGSTWHTIDIGLPNAQATQLAFEFTDYTGRGVRIDDVQVLNTSMCEGISNVIVESTAQQATITFSGSFSANFEYRLAEGAPDGATRQGVIESNQFTISVLPATTYYLYLRATCEDSYSGYTPWIETVFRTPLAVALPWTETFNTYQGSTYARPDTWKFVQGQNADIQPYIYTGVSNLSHYSMDGTAYLAFYNAQAYAPSTAALLPAGAVQTAVSPAIQADSFADVQVSFTASAHTAVGAAYAAGIIVGVMTSPDDALSFVPVDTVYMDYPHQHKRATVSLAGYTGEGRFIALRSAFDKPNFMAIDNLTIEQTVPVPSHMRVAAITAQSLTLSARLNGATAWNIHVYDVSSFADGGALPTATPLLSLTQQTASMVTLQDARLEGRSLIIYAQAVGATGATSDWSWPLAIRMPKAIACPYLFDFAEATYNLSEMLLHAPASAPQYLSDGLLAPYAAQNLRVTPAEPNYSAGGHLSMTEAGAYVVLPLVTDLPNRQLVFRLAATQGTARVMMGVVTNPYDLSSVDSLTVYSAGNQYTKCTYTFTPSSLQQGYIVLRALTGNVAIDDITVTDIPDLQDPSDVQTAVSPTSATLTWDGHGMSQWLVSVAQDAAMTMPVLDTLVHAASLTINSLTPGATYYFTVEATNLVDTTQSGAHYSFTLPYTVPYVPRFSNAQLPMGLSCLSGNLLTEAGSATQYGWRSTNSDSSPFSGYHAHINIYGSGKYALLTPELVIPQSVNQLTLSFDPALTDFHNEGAPAQEDLENTALLVCVSTNGGSTWQAVTGWGDIYGTTATVVSQSWNLIPASGTTLTIPLNGYAGQTLRVALLGYADGASLNGVNLHVANLMIRSYDANCQGLSSFRLIERTPFSLTFNWDALGTQSVDIEVATNAAFTRDVQMLTTTESPVTINGLQAQTTYYVRARQTCDTDGLWESLTAKTLCDEVSPVGFVEDFSSDIDCWQTGFRQPGASSYGSMAGTAAVSGFGDCLVLSQTESTGSHRGAYAILPQLAVGDTINRYQVVLSAATDVRASNNMACLMVGVITSPDEWNEEWLDTLHLQYASNSAAMSEYTVSLADYQGDYNGDMGRYIVLALRSHNDSINRVVIDELALRHVSEVSVCPVPQEVHATSVGINTAIVAWTGRMVNYRLEYSTDSTFATFQQTMANGRNNYTFTGLQPATTYYLRLCQLCTNGESDYSDVFTFTTQADRACLADEHYDFDTFAARSTYFSATYLPFEGDSVTDNFMLNSCWSGYGSYMSYLIDGQDLRAYFYPTEIDNDGRTVYARSGEGEGALMMTSDGTDYTTMAVMPYVESLNTVMLRFWGRAGYDSGNGMYASSFYDGRTIKVGVMSNPEDISTFTLIRTITAEPVSGMPSRDAQGTDYWRQYEVNMQGREEHYIAFLSDAESNLFFIDDVELVPVSFCAQLDAPTVDKITSTTAVAHWQTRLTNAVQLAVVQHDALLTTAVPVTISDTLQYLLHGLQPDTQYDVYVRAVCGADEFSEWTEATTFKTRCRVEAPLTYSFDEGDTYVHHSDYQSYRMQSCWTAPVFTFQAYGTPAQRTAYLRSNTSDDTYAYSGTTALYLPQSQHMEHLYVVLPELNNERMDSLQLRFKMRAASEYTGNHTLTSYTDEAHSIRVGLLTSPDDLSSFRFLGEFTTGLIETGATTSSDANQMDYWEEFKVVLEADGGRYVCFLSDYPQGNTVYIDDVEISYVSSCADVRGLQVNALATKSASLSWRSGADAFEVQLISPQDTVTNIVTGAPSAGLGTLGSMQLGTRTYGLTDLLPNTYYKVRVRARCSDEVSDWVTTSFTTLCGVPYFESFDASNQLPIGWTSLAGSLADGYAGQLAETQDSYAWTVTRFSPAGMTSNSAVVNAWGTKQYWFISPEINLTSEEASHLLLSMDVALTKYANNQVPTEAPDNNGTDDEFAILISSDGEHWTAADTYQQSLTSLSLTPQRLTLDISEYYGQTVRLALFAGSTVRNADNNLYVDNLSIMPFNPLCAAVENLQIDNLSLGNTSVSFALPEGCEQAILALSTYSVADAEHALLVDTIQATSYQLPALEPATDYYVHVAAYCGDGEQSAWQTTSFTTPKGVRYYEPFRHEAAFQEWTICDVASADNVLGGAATLHPYQTTLIDNGEWRYMPFGLGLPGNHIGQATYGGYWIVSPELDMTANVGEGVLLSFDAAWTRFTETFEEEMDYSPETNNTSVRFVCAISTNNGYTWTALRDWRNDNQGDASVQELIGGTHVSLNLSDYTGQNIRIAFHAEQIRSVGTQYHIFHVDNVLIDRCATTLVEETVCTGEPYSDGIFDIAAEAIHAGDNYFSLYQPADEVHPDNVYLLHLSQNEAVFTYQTATYSAGEMIMELGIQQEAIASCRYARAYYGMAESGCDSIVYLDVNVLPSAHVELHETICQDDVYTFGNEQLRLPGRYEMTMPAASGCDSIVILYLEVLQPVQATVADTVCHGDTYLFDGNVLSASGTYTATLISEAGCDSIVSLQLTVLDELITRLDVRMAAGETYTDSYFIGVVCPGEYTTVVTTEMGCDSTIVLTLYDPTGVYEMPNSGDKERVEKVMIDGRIYIRKGEEMYTIVGGKR